MSLHRFFISKESLNALLLDGDEWHHCRNVLRAEEGTQVALFDGAGGEYLATVHEPTPQRARLKVLHKTVTPRPRHQLALAQAIPKGKVMDFIIQKATELGVREIFPVESDRTVVRLDEGEAVARLARWRELSIEAAKQCGLNWLPVIHPIHRVKEICELRSRYGLGLMGSLQPDARPLWHYLKPGKGAAPSALMMIGPEGDFTPAELSAARAAGFQPLSLGPLVLRCDTAALYALSTLCYELGRPSEG